jgi:hypothetical protein
MVAEEEEDAVTRYVRRREANTQTNILLFMLLLLFLCMIALAVALCRMERVERSLDTMTVLMHNRPAPMAVPMTGGGGADTFYTRRYYHPRRFN